MDHHHLLQEFPMHQDEELKPLEDEEEDFLPLEVEEYHI